MSKLHKAAMAVGLMALIVGCASSQQKARRDQRDKAVQAAKLYCEFVNGEQYPDVDVAVNLSMAQKCDSEKPFSVSGYKTPSEISGVIYCCAVSSKALSVLDKKEAKLNAEKAAEKTKESE